MEMRSVAFIILIVASVSGGGTPPSSPPPPPPASGGEEELLSYSEFDDMLLHRDVCLGYEFYSYEGFIAAAKTFPEFGTTGNITTQKREIVAFLAQTSHETAGFYRYGGDYTMGYCDKTDIWTLSEDPNANYCIQSVRWPCATGKDYYGRGPMNLKYNTNYGPAGEALGYDLLNNPELLEKDEILSFRSALWFWMTPQSPKPSSHDVITGNWVPSPADVAAGRRSGYGVITNIINGDRECGIGYTINGEERIGYYKKYCDVLDLSYGDNLDCFNQIPFGSKSLIGNPYIE